MEKEYHVSITKNVIILSKLKISKLFNSVAILVILVLLTTPNLINGNRIPVLISQNPPEEIFEDYWETRNPASLGINYQKFVDMESYISGKNVNIDSINIVKDGYLVYSYYADQMRKEIPHLLYSATKSVMSILVGIALNQNLFSLDDKIIIFFPDGSIDNLDDRKANITIRHLLTMTDGLAWYETDDETNNIGNWTESITMEKFVIDKPMRADPGSTWSYNSGATHLLSHVIQHTLKRENRNLTTFEFARKYLFDPLDISIITKSWTTTYPTTDHSVTGNQWYSTPETNVLFGPSTLYLRPQDMLKIGSLMLNNGTWKGNQLVTKEWVIESTAIQQLVNSYPNHFGYHWWVFESFVYTGFLAAGADGQRIFVFPQIEMIVALTAHERDGDEIEKILDTYIAPSYSKRILEEYLASQEKDNNTNFILAPIVGIILIIGVIILIRKKSTK